MVSIPDGVTWIFHWLPAALWPWGDSASDRNEYQGSSLRGGGSQCIGLTALPPSCADCLQILGACTSWTPTGVSRPVQWIALLLLQGVIFHVAQSRMARNSTFWQNYFIWLLLCIPYNCHLKHRLKEWLLSGSSNNKFLAIASSSKLLSLENTLSVCAVQNHIPTYHNF